MWSFLDPQEQYKFVNSQKNHQENSKLEVIKRVKDRNNFNGRIKGKIQRKLLMKGKIWRELKGG